MKTVTISEIPRLTSKWLRNSFFDNAFFHCVSGPYLSFLIIISLIIMIVNIGINAYNHHHPGTFTHFGYWYIIGLLFIPVVVTILIVLILDQTGKRSKISQIKFIKKKISDLKQIPKFAEPEKEIKRIEDENWQEENFGKLFFISLFRDIALKLSNIDFHTTGNTALRILREKIEDEKQKFEAEKKAWHEEIKNWEKLLEIYEWKLSLNKKEEIC